MPRPTAVPGNSTTVRSSLAVRLLGRAIRGLDRLSPALGAAWTERLFLTPRRHSLPERERAWLEGARPGELRFGALRLPTWSWGDGPPVVLAHGWEGRGAQLGAFVAPLVASGRRVVAFDAPAHGRAPGRRTNLLEMSAVIRALVESLGEPAGLVAHSFGAAATTVALRLPLAPLAPLALERVVYLAPAETFAPFTAAFGAALGLPADLVDRMQRRIERRFGTPWDGLRGREIAPRLDLPLLVLHDRDDAEVPCAHGETLAAAWPGARLHRTSGLGHRRILRDPEVVARAVAFLVGEPAASVAPPAEPALALVAGPG